jgi:hypothetical protein
VIFIHSDLKVLDKSEVWLALTPGGIIERRRDSGLDREISRGAAAAEITGGIFQQLLK